MSALPPASISSWCQYNCDAGAGKNLLHVLCGLKNPHKVQIARGEMNMPPCNASPTAAQGPTPCVTSIREPLRRGPTRRRHNLPAPLRTPFSLAIRGRNSFAAPSPSRSGMVMPSTTESGPTRTTASATPPVRNRPNDVKWAVQDIGSTEQHSEVLVCTQPARPGSHGGVVDRTKRFPGET